MATADTVTKQSRLRNTRDTAAGFFGKSERWLWGHSQPRGPIPCIRIGKSVLYDWQQLEQWQAEQLNAAEGEGQMTPEERQAIIDDIRRFHQDGDSFAEIAEKLHLPVSAVQHAIERGTLPEPQPQWKPND